MWAQPHGVSGRFVAGSLPPFPQEVLGFGESAVWEVLGYGGEDKKHGVCPHGVYILMWRPLTNK